MPGAPVLAALLSGMVFGLSAGLAPGPLLTLVIAQTLRHNVGEGIRAALAPLVSDAPIILLAYLVLSRLASLDAVMGSIALVGGGYVLFLAYETIMTAPLPLDAAGGQPRSIVKGVLVNLFNPHPYLFWGTVGVPLMLKWQQLHPAAAWVFLAAFYGLLVGAKIAVAVIVGRLKSVLRGTWYLTVMRLLGILLAVFALLLLWDAVRHFRQLDVNSWLDRFAWVRRHEALLGWLFALSIVTFLGSLVAVPWLVARLPADYFLHTKRHKVPWTDHHPVVRVTLLIVKNAVGYVFILAGLAMLVLPGQGLLTIVIGIVLLDFPGKYRLERWLIRRRYVLRPINWLRLRAGRRPLEVIDEPRGPSASRPSGTVSGK